MFRSAASLLTASVILGHAVFGSCLPHAHADEQHPLPVLGPEKAACCHADDEDHHGPHHTHPEGDSCTFLVAPKVQLPAAPHNEGCRLMAGVVLAAAGADEARSTQDPDLSRSGLPPTCSVRDVTQVWLL